MINPRLDALRDNPFDRLRALLDGIRPPAGLKPLVLSVGEPRHPPPPLVDRVIAAHRGEWGRYPQLEGTAQFRAAAAGWLRRRFGLAETAIDAERQILPVAGTREALFLAALCAVPRRKGRRRPAVLMPNPFYHVYFGAAIASGAEPVYLAAGPETGFLPDLDAIDAATFDRTALMYLCSPANPQGAVADLDYLKAAVRLARCHRFVLAVDECYAEIYDASPPPSALAACADLGGESANVLVFHSLSKRSSVPGLRSGFVAGDAELIAQFRRLRSFAGATLPPPLTAASAALWDDDAHVARNRALYREKIDLAETILGRRFAFYRPQGGFFLWLRVGDSQRAARTLWSEAAIRVLPGAYLGRNTAEDGHPGEQYIRFALIDDLTDTEDALRRLVKVL